MADAVENHGNAWLHVDGAIGLWAAASDKQKYLLAGIERADSIDTDGHKWFNMPYDSGMIIVKDAALSTARPSATSARVILSNASSFVLPLLVAALAISVRRFVLTGYAINRQRVTHRMST